MAARGRPVTLRDFLELACDSSSDGFRSYPRCLPWTDDALELQPPARLPVDGSLRRSPSRSPSSLFSLARSPSEKLATRISSLSRSFSRRIRDGFIWRRRDDEQDDVDDRDSCGFPSPLVSSCSDSEYDEADDVAIIDDEMACPFASSESEKPSSSADHGCTDDGAAADGNKMLQADGDPAVGRSSKLGMQDKQQLSPVSVLDFPFDDDDADERSDAGTCSPSFRRFPPPPPDLLHTRTTTTKQAQLLHKIRRYDGITAQAVDPVDLESRFTTTSDSCESADASTHPATTTSSSFTDTATSSSSATATTRHGDEHQSVEQDQEFRLLARLLQDQDDDTAAAAVDEVSQLLLLDFFAEGIDRRRSSEEALVRAAAEWVRDAGLRWGISDVMLSGKAALEDMERARRWMCVSDEERDVGAAVEGLVMDELVDELVEELLVVPCPSWHGDAVDGATCSKL